VLLFNRDIDREPAIIAEIGVNHEGSIDAALRILEAAAAAGVAAVKFQCYTPERFVASGDPERFERVRRFGLTEAEFRRLAEAAKAAGVAFLATPVTEDWVQFIAEASEAIKIASGDIDFEEVIRSSAATGRVVILSTGASSLDEVDRAVSWVRAEVGEDALSERLVLMHCVSAYPAPSAEVNLLAIPMLAERYGLRAGYSNHVLGTDIPLAAVALGAKVIEVHVTDSRENRSFRDHALSLEPHELQRLVFGAREVAAARGSKSKVVQPCEQAMLPAIRKGVVAARDLAVGATIADSDLMFARPGGHFSALERGSLVGRILSKPLTRGQTVTLPDLVE
jgi:N-acetylneuraminate synthase/N,N'-diacetyllegionaminate synthase